MTSPCSTRWPGWAWVCVTTGSGGPPSLPAGPPEEHPHETIAATATPRTKPARQFIACLLVGNVTGGDYPGSPITTQVAAGGWAGDASCSDRRGHALSAARET